MNAVCDPSVPLCPNAVWKPLWSKKGPFPWTLLLHQPLTWSTPLRIISYYFKIDSKHYLRLGNRNQISHHYPLHWFITGWGGKGAFVRIVRSVLGSQLWNKFRQSDAVSKVIVDLFKEKERNKNGVYYPINCYFRRDKVRHNMTIIHKNNKGCLPFAVLIFLNETAMYSIHLLNPPSTWIRAR